MGSHLSLSCDNSGEASFPKSDFSPISDTAGAEAKSSTRCCLSLKARLSAPVSGDCSANRPNKSTVCGVEVVGQSEGNSREDEVGVLCEG